MAVSKKYVGTRILCILNHSDFWLKFLYNNNDRMKLFIQQIFFDLFSFYFKYKKYEEVFYLSNNFNERENFYQSFE